MRDKSAMQVIAVDLGGTKLNVARVDESGKILARARRATGMQPSNDALLDLIAGAIEECAAPHAALAVGVGCAGQTDHRRGELVFGNNLGVRNVQVARELSRRLQLPVGVENDVNAIGLGEARFGAARGARDLIAVFVGTGIGGGFVCDGAVVRGKSGAAAEVGHAIFVPDGRACNCGQRGCYEAYCSGRAFEEIGRELMAAGEWPAEAGERLTSAGLRVAARRSQLAADHLRRAEEAIAYLGANLVTLLDPEVLVLGGGVVLHDRAFVGAVKSGIARHATLVARRDVRVELTALGEDAALLGAAAIGFEVLTKNGK